MRVTVHDIARAQLAEWRRSLGESRQVRARMHGPFWAEFVRSLADAGGPPPGSMPHPGPGSRKWWVAFPPRYMALVRFRETRAFFGLVVRREAVVIEFNFSPGLPDPVAPGT